MSMKSLGETVMVLGSSNRLGREVALFLAHCGYDIIVHYHTNKKGGEETLSMIRSIGRKASLVCGDITTKEGVDSLFVDLSDLTSIVNCASIFIDSPFGSVDEERFDTDQLIHQKGPFFLTQRLFLYSKEREIRTSMIHLTDAQTTHPSSLKPSYYIAKSALEEQIRILALHSAPYVRVNGVAPGLIISNNEQEEAYFKKRKEVIPLKRLAAKDDVSSTVEFLIKNKAITGQIIKVDSGEFLL
ncbi:MAG: SDR family oxidoreductase [Spirochaetia bacterium]|nr:SDR family oxidoreductase [Spirochaetia bacterium]